MGKLPRDISGGQMVAALQPALRKEWKVPVKLYFREVERDVCVVRGKWAFKPISEDFPAVQIYGNYFGKRSTGGGGSGDFKRFLRADGSWIHMPIVDDVREPPAKKRISWRFHRPLSKRVKTTEDHDPDIVTSNLAKQTGLEFNVERRKTRILFVER